MATKTAQTPVVHERKEDGSYVARPDLSQCETKTAKGRRCKLNAGHTGDHAYVLRSAVPAPKMLSELRQEKATARKFATFTLTAQDVPLGSVQREYTREPIERDADQKRVDADALAAYKSWEKAGKPTDKKKVPFKRYIFPPEAFDAVILMLRRATQAGGPVQGKRLLYSRGTHTSGDAMVFFAVTDRPANGD